MNTSNNELLAARLKLRAAQTALLASLVGLLQFAGEAALRWWLG